VRILVGPCLECKVDDRLLWVVELTISETGGGEGSIVYECLTCHTRHSAEFHLPPVSGRLARPGLSSVKRGV